MRWFVVDGSPPKPKVFSSTTHPQPPRPPGLRSHAPSVKTTVDAVMGSVSRLLCPRLVPTPPIAAVSLMYATYPCSRTGHGHRWNDARWSRLARNVRVAGSRLD